MDNAFEKSNEPENEFKFSKLSLESVLRKAKNPFFRYYFNGFCLIIKLLKKEGRLFFYPEGNSENNKRKGCYTKKDYKFFRFL